MGLLRRGLERIGISVPAGPRRIESVRLILRPPRLEDFEGWARLRRENRDFLQPWEPLWPRDHLTHAAFRGRVRWAARQGRAGRAHAFLMFERQSGAVIGGVTLSNIRGAPVRSGTLGYWVGRSRARQGFASEAVSRVTDFAFDELGLRRVEAACLEENLASRALLTRCGFTYEGIVRGYLEVNGVTRDHMLFARIAEDGQR